MIPEDGSSRIVRPLPETLIMSTCDRVARPSVAHGDDPQAISSSRTRSAMTTSPSRDRIRAVAVRLTPTQLLGLLSASALLISLGAAIAFAEITESVLRGERATTIDAEINTWMASHRTAWATAVMKALTHLADPLTVAVITAVVAAMAWRRGRPRLAGFMIAATAITGLLVTTTKLVIARPRPATVDRLIAVSGASFPSGHAAQSVACYVALAILVMWTTRSKALSAVALGSAIVLALGIGASRVYLNVHWTSDVVAGWALAAAWITALTGVVLAWRTLERWRRRQADAAGT
jgi:membrane-associated phospholipid phosphatase